MPNQNNKKALFLTHWEEIFLSNTLRYLIIQRRKDLYEAIIHGANVYPDVELRIRQDIDTMENLLEKLHDISFLREEAPNAETK